MKYLKQHLSLIFICILGAVGCAGGSIFSWTNTLDVGEFDSSDKFRHHLVSRDRFFSVAYRVYDNTPIQINYNEGSKTLWEQQIPGIENQRLYTSFGLNTAEGDQLALVYELDPTTYEVVFIDENGEQGSPIQLVGEDPEFAILSGTLGAIIGQDGVSQLVTLTSSNSWQLLADLDSDHFQASLLAAQEKWIVVARQDNSIAVIDSEGALLWSYSVEGDDSLYRARINNNALVMTIGFPSQGNYTSLSLSDGSVTPLPAPDEFFLERINTDDQLIGWSRSDGEYYLTMLDPEGETLWQNTQPYAEALPITMSPTSEDIFFINPVTEKLDEVLGNQIYKDSSIVMQFSATGEQINQYASSHEYFFNGCGFGCGIGVTKAGFEMTELISNESGEIYTVGNYYYVSAIPIVKTFRSFFGKLKLAGNQ